MLKRFSKRVRIPSVSDVVVGTARTFGSAYGAFIKASGLLKNPEFVAGLSETSQWSGGVFSNNENQQMRAVRNGWIYAAVNTKALTLSSSQRDIFYNPSGIEGEGEKAEAHPFYKVLRRPNPYMGSGLLWQYSQWWMDLAGEAFWFSNPRGGVSGNGEIWPMPSSKVDIEFTPDGKKIKRYVLKLTKWYYIDPNYVTHFKYANPFDFFRGLPPLVAAMLSVDTDLAMKFWNGSFFGKDNVMPSAVISLGSGDPARPIDPEDVDEVKRELQEEYSAIRRKTVITNANSMSVALLGYNAKDMDFLAGMKWNKEEILTIMGVPPGIYDVNATEANSTVADKKYKDNMWGVKNIFDDEITASLFGLWYPDANLEMRHEDDRYVDRDLELKEAVIAKDAMTKEEWRMKYFNLPPLAEGEMTMSEERMKNSAALRPQPGAPGNITQGKPEVNNPKPADGLDNKKPVKKSVELVGVPEYKVGHLPTIMLTSLTNNKGARTTEALLSMRDKYKKEGIINPIILRRDVSDDMDLEILDGKHRVDFAVELNIEQVPVKVFDVGGQEIDPKLVYAEWLAKRGSHVITGTKSIIHDLLLYKRKSKNYFKTKNNADVRFVSDAIPDETLKSISKDLQGVERPEDIDEIFAHWESNLKGGPGSGENDGHPFTKALSWRPWSGFEASLTAVILEAFDALLSLFIDRAKQQQEKMVDDVSMWDEADRIVRDKMQPVFIDIAEQSVKDVTKILSESGVSISYDITSIAARDWALANSATQISKISETHKKAVRREIANWLDDGKPEGIDGLTKRLRGMTDENGNLLFSKARAHTIAQNEATSIYVGSTVAALEANGYLPAVYKPRAHVNCRCYVQPATLSDGAKVIVWYTARDERANCHAKIETPFGKFESCSNLHRTVLSEGYAGQKWTGGMWNPDRSA